MEESKIIVNAAGKRVVKSSDLFYVRIGAHPQLYDFTAAELSYSSMFTRILQMEPAKSEEDTQFRAELFIRPELDKRRFEDKGRVDRIAELCVKTPAFFGVNGVGTREMPIVLDEEQYTAHIHETTAEVETRAKVSPEHMEIVHRWFVAHRANTDEIAYLISQPVNSNNHSQLKFQSEIDTKFFNDFGDLLVTLKKGPKDEARDESKDPKQIARNKILWLQDIMAFTHEVLDIEPLTDRIMAWAAVFANSLPDEVLGAAKINIDDSQDNTALRNSLNNNKEVITQTDDPE